MVDDQLRKSVVEQLRKAHEPLSPVELFERCGGAKTTNHSLDSFVAFIGQHCSRAVRVIHDAGDENSFPRFALHVDSSRKTGTLKRRATRSKSQSSSRGGTPDESAMRFNPRTDGFSIFCHIIQKLSSSSQDGTLNWNVIRNHYRRETGRHLNAEELNLMCGTTNKTKHDLLRTHLSTVLEIVDSRGQIVRPASPFCPKTPSPTSSNSRSSEADDQLLSPSTLFDINQVDHVQGSARRRHIVEQLRRNGVFVDENGRAILPGRSPLSSQGSEYSSHELNSPRDYLTPSDMASNGRYDVADFITPTSELNGEVGSQPGSDATQFSGQSERFQSPESDQSSFLSVAQVLDTSGEGGYATGYDATPESDVSLNYSVDRSAHEGTPIRTHEITLCNPEDSMHEEVEATQHTVVDDITQIESTECDSKVAGNHPSLAETGYMCSTVEAQKDDERFEEKSFSSKDFVFGTADETAEEIHAIPSGDVTQWSKMSDEYYVASTPYSPSTEHSGASYHLHGEEEETETTHGSDEVFEDNVIDLSQKSFEPVDLNKSFSEAEVGEQDIVVELTSPVRERRLVFEEGFEANDPSVVTHDTHMPESVAEQIKQKVEKFERLDETDIDESQSNRFVEGDLVANVDVMEIVHDIEQSALEADVVAIEHDNEVMPPKVRVLEKVHRLEHEIDPSLPVCEEYEHIINKQRLDAGDATMTGLFTDEVTSAATDVRRVKEYTCVENIAQTQTDDAASETIVLTVEEAEDNNSVVTAKHDIIWEDNNSVVTAKDEDATKVPSAKVDDNVGVDGTLKLSFDRFSIDFCERWPPTRKSDSWEREFVVATGTTASQISQNGYDASLSDDHGDMLEVEDLRSIDAKEVSDNKRAVIVTEEIGELKVSKDMPSIPIAITEENIADAKSVSRKRSPGHVLLPRRRIIDCCSIL